MGTTLLRLVGVGGCTVLVGVSLAQTGFAAQRSQPSTVSRIEGERRPEALAGVAAVAAASASAVPALTGAVTAGGRTSVQGYLVEAFTSDGNFVADTTTDAAGRYSFPTLQAGRYLVRVSGPAAGPAPWAMAWAGGATMQEARVLLVEASGQTADVSLAPAATLTGEVRGVPTGSEVRVCGPSFLDCRFAPTDAVGRFSITGLAAGVDSIVVHPVGGADLAFPKDPPRFGVTLRSGRTTTVTLDAQTQAAPVVMVGQKVIKPPVPPATRDRTAPTVTSAKIQSEGGKRYVTVDATDHQAGSGIRSVQLRIGTTVLAPIAFTADPLAAPGAGRVAVRVRDRAGNSSKWQAAK